MKRYNLDEILLKAEVPDVALRLGMKTERRGGSVVALCPFHDDRRPSLVLYPSSPQGSSHFHCFTCSAHGFAIDLVKKVQGLDFKPAVEWLAGYLGIRPTSISMGRFSPSKSTREEALSFAHRIFDKAHDSLAFNAWCATRRFSPEYLFSLGLRCLPSGSPLTASLRGKSFGEQQFLIDGLIAAGLLVRLRAEIRNDAQSSLNLSEQFRDYFHDGRILIPVHSVTSSLVGFAGRHWLATPNAVENQDRSPKYLFTPGFKKSDTLFNSDSARKASSEEYVTGSITSDLYVVEGFVDALRLRSLGLRSVAVMGTSISEQQRKQLIDIAENIQSTGTQHPKIRLFFDRDLAGFEGAIRAIRQLLGIPGVSTEWVGFGEQDVSLTGKDPDELLSALSREAASRILEEHAMPAIGALVHPCCVAHQQGCAPSRSP